MKTWKHWTASETRRVEALVMAGREHAEIARQLGRTLSAVKAHCQQEGIHAPLKRAGQYLAVLSLGLSVCEEAHRLGVQPQTARRARWKLRRLGLLRKARS